MDKKTNKISNQPYLVESLKQWEWRFRKIPPKEMKKQLVWHELNDPTNQIVHVVTSIYQMHSFVYENLNRASWNQEDDKIDTLGPFSFCLSQILRGEASNRRQDSQAIEFKKKLFKEVTKSKKGKIKKVKDRTYGHTLYRGYRMKPEELD